MTTTVSGLVGAGTRRLRDSGSESARLDAELLLGHVLGVDRTALVAYPEALVGDGSASSFLGLIERRAAGEPVAYLRGVKEFHGLALAVDPRVLIPRPDTETLVDLALAAIRERLASSPRPAGTPTLRIWDVATGSGAIPIAIAVELRRMRALEHLSLLMSDVSRDALAVALENAVAHGVADRIEAAVGDLFHVEPSPVLPVDVVTANLPYIPSAVVPGLPVAASYEPVVALDGGPDGLDLVRRLLDDLSPVLALDGRAYLEIGADQAERVATEAAARLPGWSARIHPDLGGRPRVLEVAPPTRHAPSSGTSRHG